MTSFLQWFVFCQLIPQLIINYVSDSAMSNRIPVC